MKALGNVPEFPFAFVRGKKLLPWRVAHEVLQTEYQQLPTNPTNKKDLNRKQRLAKDMKHLRRKQHALEQIAAKRHTTSNTNDEVSARPTAELSATIEQEASTVYHDAPTQTAEI